VGFGWQDVQAGHRLDGGFELPAHALGRSATLAHVARRATLEADLVGAVTKSRWHQARTAASRARRGLRDHIVTGLDERFIAGARMLVKS